MLMVYQEYLVIIQMLISKKKLPLLVQYLWTIIIDISSLNNNELKLGTGLSLLGIIFLSEVSLKAGTIPYEILNCVIIE